MSTNTVSRSEAARQLGVTPAAVTKAAKTWLLPALVGKRVDMDHPDVVAYIKTAAANQTPEVAPGIDGRYTEAAVWCAANSYNADKLAAALGIPRDRARVIVKQLRANPPDVTTLPTVGPTTHDSPRGHAAKKIALKKAPPEKPVDGLLEVPEDIRLLADLPLRELVERFGTDVRFLEWLKATKEIENINGVRIKNAKAEGLLVSREVVQVGVIDVFSSALMRLMTDGAKTLAAEIVMRHKAGGTEAQIEAQVSEVLGSFIKPIKAKAARALRNA